MLRQELRHAAAARSQLRSVKAPAEAQLTDAERVLIRALASASQMQLGEHVSGQRREGQDRTSIPRARRTLSCSSERLHAAWPPKSLIEALLTAHEQGLPIPCRCRWTRPTGACWHRS